MVLPLAIGAGMSVLGGIAGGIGQRQQANKTLGGLRQALRGARQFQQANERNLDYTQGQFAPLAGQRNEQMSGLIQAMGPAQRQAVQDALPGIQQALAGGEDQIRGMLRPTFNPQAGAGGNVMLDQSRALASRMAPGQALQQLRMQHAAAAPEIAGMRSGIFDAMGATDRTAGQIMSDQGLRQALAGQQFGISQDAAQQAIADARYAGGGLRALGGFMQGLAPGITTMGAVQGWGKKPAVNPPPPGDPNNPPLGPLAPGAESDAAAYNVLMQNGLLPGWNYNP